MSVVYVVHAFNQPTRVCLSFSLELYRGVGEKVKIIKKCSLSLSCSESRIDTITNIKHD
jgi:hypothetical protein